MKKIVLILAAIILLIASDCFGYKQEIVWMPMSDGVELYTVIWYPNEMQADEKLPIVLVRTIYGAGTANANASTLPKNIIVDNLRYIFIEQDIRGTTKSPGKFYGLQEEGAKNKDGYDAIDWITKQKWSNGKVCMYGLSNSAHSQYFTVLTNPPNLVCGFANCGTWDTHLDLFYPGGVFRFAFYNWLVYTLNNYEAGQMLLDSSSINCESAKLADLSRRKEKFNIPIFHVAGWYDYILGPSDLKAFYDINYFGGENAKGKQKVMIGPWVHYPVGVRNVGSITFPQNAAVDISQLAYDWFEYWMNGKKDNRIADYPNLSLYLMGPVDTAGYWNNWLYYQDWPFTDTDTIRFYPSNDETLSKQKPNENQKTLIYDPDNPFQGLTIENGPQDLSSKWSDRKILTFKTPIYDEPYDIFGGIKFEVYLSSDREDTDVISQMVDIYPDGRIIPLTLGVLKARYRSDFEKEDFLIPDEIAKMTIDFHHIAYTIVPGHKLGLLLSCSNSSMYWPNPNTRDPVNRPKDTLIANNTFHFGGNNATVLVLPIRKPGAVSVNENIKKQDITISPNPFTESTSIHYELQTAGRVRIDIFNSLGEKITTLVDEWQETGKHNYELGIRNYELSAGMYFYRIQIGDRIESGKLILIR